jgi:hypothetical protein
LQLHRHTRAAGLYRLPQPYRRGGCHRRQFCQSGAHLKLNSTIPVKFTSACGGSPVLSGIHRLQVIKYADQTTAGDPIDATPTDAATTGDEFRLNGGQWQFNLDTKATGMSAGIWLFVATLSDGGQHSTWIQIK